VVVHDFCIILDLLSKWEVVITDTLLVITDTLLVMFSYISVFLYMQY